MKPEQKEQNYRIAEKLLDEQNFAAGAIFGAGAAILGAAIYAVTGLALGFISGYIAIALGALVGLTIRFIGRGIEPRFPVLACVLAVAGCLLGNALLAGLIRARNYGSGMADILHGIEPADAIGFLLANLSFADFAFWMLAAAAAGFLARRRLSREQWFAVYTLQRMPRDDRIVT